MKISVIIPVYNVEQYLSDCLNSVVNQSYKNIEIIIINDGTTDGSLRIAREFAKKDKRILIISKLNGGLSSARNMGLEVIENTPLRECLNNLDSKKVIEKFKNKLVIKKISSNEFEIMARDIYEFIEPAKLSNNSLVHFLDSDDYLKNYCLQECIEAFKKINDLDIFWHDRATLIEKELKNHTYAILFEKTLSFKSEEYVISEIPDNERNNNLISKYNMDVVDRRNGLIYVKNYVMDSGVQCLEIMNAWLFWWGWHGCFRASVLNTINLRFTHAIEYEDNDFGTILFGIARKNVCSLNTSLVYRIRENSIMNSYSTQVNMPYYLESINHYFDTYRETKEYYRGYSFLLVHKKILKYANDKTILKNIAFNYLNLVIDILNKVTPDKDPLKTREILGNEKVFLRFPKLMKYKKFFQPSRYANYIKKRLILKEKR